MDMYTPGIERQKVLEEVRSRFSASAERVGSEAFFRGLLHLLDRRLCKVGMRISAFGLPGVNLDTIERIECLFCEIWTSVEETGLPENEKQDIAAQLFRWVSDERARPHLLAVLASDATQRL